jgi:bacteriocin-like protein
MSCINTHRADPNILTHEELSHIVGGAPSISEAQVRKASTRLGNNDFTADMGVAAPRINDMDSDMG